MVNLSHVFHLTVSSCARQRLSLRTGTLQGGKAWRCKTGEWWGGKQEMFAGPPIHSPGEGRCLQPSKPQGWGEGMIERQYYQQISRLPVPRRIVKDSHCSACQGKAGQASQATGPQRTLCQGQRCSRACRLGVSKAFALSGPASSSLSVVSSNTVFLPLSITHIFGIAGAHSYLTLNTLFLLKVFPEHQLMKLPCSPWRLALGRIIPMAGICPKA